MRELIGITTALLEPENRGCAKPRSARIIRIPTVVCNDLRVRILRWTVSRSRGQLARSSKADSEAMLKAVEQIRHKPSIRVTRECCSPCLRPEGCGNFCQGWMRCCGDCRAAAVHRDQVGSVAVPCAHRVKASITYRLRTPSALASPSCRVCIHYSTRAYSTGI